MTIIKNSTNNKYWQGCQQKGTWVHCWENCNLVQPLWKTIWNSSEKNKGRTTILASNSIVNIYLKKPKALIWKDIGNPMLITALFTIAKMWKQYKSPSTDEQINMCHIYTMEYHLVIKKNEILPFATTWMDRENYASVKYVRQRKTNTLYYNLYVESKR